MNLTAKDPIIASIISWIESQEIDLQPDFQRGMVWSRDKQQLLVDTIFREWQIPPVFVISDDAFRKEVLDGQQRLQSIYNFYSGVFPINGNLQPHSATLERLHGKYFKDLPPEEKRRFLNFSIRIFEITKYAEGEPFELFYRLNQSVKLTSAERRNTFHGEPRTQIKKLVEFMEEVGFNRDLIGFNNSRLSYSDVIARVCFVLEAKSFESKVTDKDITNRYREDSGFSPELVLRVESTIMILRDAIRLTGQKFKLSKPTLFSWIIFITQLDAATMESVSEFIHRFRAVIQEAEAVSGDFTPDETINRWVVKEYVYRSSTSVNDSKSILFRHFALGYLWFHGSEAQTSSGEFFCKINKIVPVFECEFIEEDVYQSIARANLGRLA